MIYVVQTNEKTEYSVESIKGYKSAEKFISENKIKAYYYHGDGFIHGIYLIYKASTIKGINGKDLKLTPYSQIWDKEPPKELRMIRASFFKFIPLWANIESKGKFSVILNATGGHVSREANKLLMRINATTDLNKLYSEYESYLKKLCSELPSCKQLIQQSLRTEVSILQKFSKGRNERKYLDIEQDVNLNTWGDLLKKAMDFLFSDWDPVIIEGSAYAKKCLNILESVLDDKEYNIPDNRPSNLKDNEAVFPSFKALKSLQTVAKQIIDQGMLKQIVKKIAVLTCKIYIAMELALPVLDSKSEPSAVYAIQSDPSKFDTMSMVIVSYLLLLQNKGQAMANQIKDYALFTKGPKGLSSQDKSILKTFGISDFSSPVYIALIEKFLGRSNFFHRYTLSTSGKLIITPDPGISPVRVCVCSNVLTAPSGTNMVTVKRKDEPKTVTAPTKDLVNSHRTVDIWELMSDYPLDTGYQLPTSPTSPLHPTKVYA